MFEEKYQKPDANYIAGVIWRKFINFLLSYPELMFFGKIVGALVIFGILFLLLKQFLGID